MGSKYTYTQSVVPANLTAGANEIMAKQAEINSRPTETYGGARIEGFNSDQTKGFDATRNATTGYQGGFDKATGAIEGALSRSTTNAISPFMSAVLDTSGQQPATDMLGRAQQYTEMGAKPLGLEMAQPWLDKAGGRATDDIDAYMNPYMSKVLDQFAERGARNLNEVLIPGATNKFIGAGQLGGGPARGGGAGPASGYMTDTARALRDTQDSVNKQTAEMMMGGWKDALAASGADKARYGTIGATYGNLGTAAQEGYSRAGQGLSDISGRYSAIDFGNRGLAKDAMSTYASAYGQDTANQLTGGGALADITNNRSNLDFKSADALTSIGDKEQALGQANRDVAYQDWLKQTGADQAKLDKTTSTMGALAGMFPQGTMSYEGSKAPSASIGQTALGLGATALGASLR